MMYHHRRFLSAHTCYSYYCDPPLPPPPPPPPPPPLSDSDTNPSPSRSHGLSNSLLLAASLLSAAVLLVLTFFAVIRRRRRHHHRQLLAAGTLDPAGNDEDGDGGGREEPLHHAWYIRTVGLDDAAIASIPVSAHRGSGVGGGGGGGDCSVCLGEFGDGELVRLLPKCAHPFHLSCIDTWLRAHVTCPLCRSPVVDPSTNAAAAAAADDPSVASIPTPIAAADAADAESDPTQSGSDDGEASHEEEEEEEEVGEIENRAAILEQESDCPDSPSPGSELQAPIHPLIGRSVSMDSPHVAVSAAPEPEERELNSQEDQIVTEEKEKDLRADLSKAPATSARLEIERSLSSSARGFFFSRHGRARSSILPL